MPRRITVIASATASTSSSLCEMKMTVSPSAVSSRRLSKSSSTSCGTSTAVGSSRMRIFAPAVEHLEDLDPLPVADAEILDERVGLDAEPVGVGDLLDRARARREVEPMPPLDGSLAEDDVLQHGEVVGEHEVLVHHADAEPRWRRCGECEVHLAARRSAIVPSSGCCMP